MKIKQATLKDLEIILKFIGPKQLQRKDWHIKSKKFITSYIKNKHNFFLIAIDKNKVIGIINGELWGDKGFAYLGEIEAKGKNKTEIINKLFKYFKNYCKKRNINLINSYVNKNKSTLIKTYKRLRMKQKGTYLYFERRI